MTHEDEMKLTRELGELRAHYTLCDKSEENLKRGQRIKEIMEELNLGCESRADYRKSVIRWR